MNYEKIKRIIRQSVDEMYKYPMQGFGVPVFFDPETNELSVGDGLLSQSSWTEGPLVEVGRINGWGYDLSPQVEFIDDCQSATRSSELMATSLKKLCDEKGIDPSEVWDGYWTEFLSMPGMDAEYAQWHSIWYDERIEAACVLLADEIENNINQLKTNQL